MLAHYPSGSDLFTTLVEDGSRRSVGVTRWLVEVKYDPRDRMPDGFSGPSCPGPAEARARPEVRRGCNKSCSVGCYGRVATAKCSNLLATHCGRSSGV